MSLPEVERRRIAEMFSRDFGTGLYGTIGTALAHSIRTLDLFEKVEPHKRRPVLLFAAVHYLELRGYSSQLTKIYASPDATTSRERAARVFVNFCQEYSAQIIDLMMARSVQTNEVNRCVGLLPALMEAARMSHRDLAVIELGASAGLNLLFDHFHYDYVGGPQLGQHGSPVRLSTEVRGTAPRLDSAIPLVDHHVGVDLDPVDYKDDDAVLWLRACVWAGDLARDQRLMAAIDLARREWPEVRKANVLTALPALIDEVDENLALCIYNSWMMGWMSREERHRLDEMLHNIAMRREIWWITFEGAGHVPGLPDPDDLPSDASVLGLRFLSRNVDEPRVLAQMQHHGAWIKWI